MKSTDSLLKILLIGPISTGKSSILTRFYDNWFQDAYIPTLGIDFRIRAFNFSGDIFKVQVWDTSGQPRFFSITTCYFKGSHGALFVFNLCDRNTFDQIDAMIKSYCSKASPEAKEMLLGNFCDAEKGRAVSYQEAADKAAKFGMMYMETSAKTNFNIKEAFSEFIKLLTKPK